MFVAGLAEETRTAPGLKPLRCQRGARVVEQERNCNEDAQRASVTIGIPPPHFPSNSCAGIATTRTAGPNDPHKLATSFTSSSSSTKSVTDDLLVVSTTVPGRRHGPRQWIRPLDIRRRGDRACARIMSSVFACVLTSLVAYGRSLGDLRRRLGRFPTRRANRIRGEPCGNRRSTPHGAEHGLYRVRSARRSG